MPVYHHITLVEHVDAFHRSQGLVHQEIVLQIVRRYFCLKNEPTILQHRGQAFTFRHCLQQRIRIKTLRRCSLGKLVCVFTESRLVIMFTHSLFFLLTVVSRSIQRGILQRRRDFRIWQILRKRRFDVIVLLLRNVKAEVCVFTMISQNVPKLQCVRKQRNQD